MLFHSLLVAPFHGVGRGSSAESGRTEIRLARTAAGHPSIHPFMRVAQQNIFVFVSWLVADAAAVAFACLI